MTVSFPPTPTFEIITLTLTLTLTGGKDRLSFPRFLEDWYLAKHKNRNEVMLAIEGSLQMCPLTLTLTLTGGYVGDRGSL